MRDPHGVSRDAAEVNAGGRYSLLASAIAARPLEVAPGDAGVAAWTDGRRILIDPDVDGGLSWRASWSRPP